MGHFDNLKDILYTVSPHKFSVIALQEIWSVGKSFVLPGYSPLIFNTRDKNSSSPQPNCGGGVGFFTDANYTDGLDEAIDRCKMFLDIGVDITFLEAPRSEMEMERYCNEVPGVKMANMVEQGNTPFLSPSKLEAIGYKIAIFPVSLMLAGIKAMENTLLKMGVGHNTEALATFGHLQEIVGFPEYYDAEKLYSHE